jgi:hypothetical protein
MAGLWERVNDAADDNVQVHLIVAGIKANGAGLFTPQQILDAVNAKLESPLAGAEVTDLNDITTVLSGKATTTDKLVYVNVVEAMFVSAEVGAVDETQWRTSLEI